MTTVVLDSADLVEAVTTGTVPVPKGIAEDNAKQAEKRGEKTEKDPVIEAQKAIEAEQKAKTEVKAEEEDDIEGEDGLTPRQKREFTQSMLKTISKKHRMQKEAEEFATSQFNQKTLAEKQAADLARENAELKAKLTPAPKVEEIKVPDRADFKDDQAYWDAMVDYRVDQKLRVAQAEAAKVQEENRQAEIAAHAAKNIERAMELVPDFKEVTESADLAVPPYVAGYMQESDLFGELGYHFAKHPEDLERLSKITAGVREGTRAYTQAVTKQLVELGKIESTLQPFGSKKANGAEDTKESKPSTDGRQTERETGSAPSKPRVQAPIIAPLNGGSAAVKTDEADMSRSQVITAWQRKHGVTLTARKRH